MIFGVDGAGGYGVDANAFGCELFARPLVAVERPAFAVE
jgi:hypothetical protein